LFVNKKPEQSTERVARFNANSDRANLNCNRDPQSSKFIKNEIEVLGMVYAAKALKCILILICIINLFL